MGAIVLPAFGPLLAMLLAARFLANDFSIKQLNGITFTAGCVGMLLMLGNLRTKLQFLGCALLAFSIGLKLITLPLLAMLIIKRAWWQSAAVATAAAFLFWGFPFLVLGPTEYFQLHNKTFADAPGMWLQIQDSTHLWSFVNFLAYRIYSAPLIPGTEQLPTWIFQLICLSVTLLVGLPILRVMLGRPWRDMSPRHL